MAGELDCPICSALLNLLCVLQVAELRLHVVALCMIVIVNFRYDLN
jgi:hypothetical protein